MHQETEKALLDVRAKHVVLQCKRQAVQSMPALRPLNLPADLKQIKVNSLADFSLKQFGAIVLIDQSVHGTGLQKSLQKFILP